MLNNLAVKFHVQKMIPMNCAILLVLKSNAETVWLEKSSPTAYHLEYDYYTCILINV